VVVKLGTIHVSLAGTFSIKKLKTTTSTSNVPGGKQTDYTISSIRGKFKNAKTATGSITYSNGFSAPGITHSCGSSTVTFKATTK
jgi:hypothetical protein